MIQTYTLETAVESATELSAMQHLESLGVLRATNAKLSDLDHQANLFFIKAQMTEDEITDKVYHNLKKDKKVFILSDDLSAKRANEVIAATTIVERQMKKLIICVLPEIEEVFDELIKPHQKQRSLRNPANRIALSQDISELSIGSIPHVLEQDISILSKDKLLSSEGLAALIIDSQNFDEFKSRIKVLSNTRTVWDCINSILESSTDYANISKALSSVCEMRNKASHLQTITLRELKDLHKNQKHLMKYIGEIKSDYRNRLQDNVQSIAKTMQLSIDLMAKINPKLHQDIQDQLADLYKPIIDSVAKIKLDPKSPDLAKIIQGNVNIRQDVIDSINKVTKNIPTTEEYKKVLSGIQKHGMEQYFTNLSAEADDMATALKEIEAIPENSEEGKK